MLHRYAIPVLTVYADTFVQPADLKTRKCTGTADLIHLLYFYIAIFAFEIQSADLPEFGIGKLIIQAQAARRFDFHF